MIETFYGALYELQEPPTPEDVADALWLATRLRLSGRTSESLPPRTNGGQPKDEPDEAPDDEGGAPRSLDTTGQSLGRERVRQPDTGAGLISGPVGLPRKRGTSSDLAGLVGIRTPGAPALSGTRILARALRPLCRTTPSRTRLVLDEEATVRRVVEEHLWIPVMRAAADRWLEVALVADVGPSMRVWRQTVEEFRLLLERQGAFGDVRAWALDTCRSTEVILTPAGGGPPRRIEELVEPTGRRLILVVTDCICPAWYGGAAAAAVTAWARTQPVALVQMLPERLWMQTALGDARLVRVSAPYPGAPSGVLRKQAVSGRPRRDVPGLAVPVVPLEPEFLGRWARLLAGRGASRAPGAILNTEPSPRPADDPATPGPHRVQEFQARASATAFRLACLLAAAPLRLPIMRLVQRVMLPDSTQVHLAEVFSSGLLRRDWSVEAAGDPEWTHYDFQPGVREALLDLELVPRAVQVQKLVSSYIAERFGHPLDFQAFVVDPGSVDRLSLEEAARPFATVAAEVLARLGGSYTTAAERLRERLEPSVEHGTRAPVRRHVALLVGLSAPLNPYTLELRSPAADVAALEQVLKRTRTSVHTLVNESFDQSVFWDVLSSLQVSAEADTLLWLHYSGHGVLAEGRPVLLPQERGEQRISGVYLDELVDAVRSRMGARLLLTLDARPPRSRGSTGASEEFLVRAAEVAREEAFVGVYLYETAEQGALTSVLLEAMRDRETLTIGELAQYVESRFAQQPDRPYGSPIVQVQGFQSLVLLDERFDPAASPNRQDIMRRLRRVIAEVSGNPEDVVVPNADLVDDLGMDDLGITELVTRLEEEFGVSIPGEDVGGPSQILYDSEDGSEDHSEVYE